MYISSCFQLLTLCSTSGRWTHVWGIIGEIMQIWWEKNEVFREKHEPAQLFHHKSHSHWLAIQQFSDIYNWSWSRYHYITILSLILLIPTHEAVTTNRPTTSLFWSANTNLRMWSCTAANVRCCHSTNSKSPATQQQSVILHITAFWSQLLARRQIQQPLK